MNEQEQQQQLQRQQPLQQEQQRRYDMAILPQMTERQLDSEHLSKHQKDRGLSSVRQAALHQMPEVYDEIDSVRMNSDEHARTTRFHHARGTSIKEQGGSVLKIDVAGSGFQSFRTEHKGLKGKGRVRLENLLDQTKDGLKVEEEKKKIKKELTVSWYNRSKFLNWIGLTKNEAQINAANAQIREDNAMTMQRIEEIKSKLNGELGDPVTLAGRQLAHVRKKVEGTKTKISMAGPLGGIFGKGKGLRNSGEYSIENLRKYMLTMGQEYLTNTCGNPEFAQNPHDVTIEIKGHSRGGVACVEGAMMIKYWVKTEHPDWLPFVKFDVVQYDPVPGAGSASGVNEMVDLRGEEVVESGKDKMLPLGDSAETTVFYSMDTEHNVGFTPQLVKGAKRVILAPAKHGINLGDIEKTKKRSANGTETEELHRSHFLDSETGELFRGSGISELPPGLYMVDERNTLVRFTDLAKAMAAYEEIIKDTWATQRGRHYVMRSVINGFFGGGEDPAADSQPQQ